jgi:hypothetical protein
MYTILHFYCLFPALDLGSLGMGKVFSSPALCILPSTTPGRVTLSSLCLTCFFLWSSCDFCWHQLWLFLRSKACTHLYAYSQSVHTSVFSGNKLVKVSRFSGPPLVFPELWALLDVWVYYCDCQWQARWHLWTSVSTSAHSQFTYKPFGPSGSNSLHELGFDLDIFCIISAWASLSWS